MNGRRDESRLRKKLLIQLEHQFKGVKVVENANLIYKVIVQEQSKGSLRFDPNTPNDPGRGHYAFQTDLALVNSRSGIPLVVIELKSQHLSTHDVLTYSTKATRHKEIYPYIRYGLVVGGMDEISKKFFTHNMGFDFAFALKNHSDINVKKLEKILKLQLRTARKLLGIFTLRKKTTEFNQIARFK